MDDETNMYLENIEEYVLDEDRVVTYKWLSQTLEIHVNLAKRLLETFLTEQKKKKSPTLCVTYAVTGTQQTPNGTQMTKIAVVNEEGLDAVKSGMKEVLGQHVFSIQKSALKDNSSLFSTDYEITKQNITQTNRFSAIQCKAVEVRSLADLERVRESQQTSSTEKSKVNGFGNQNTSSTSSKATSSKATSSSSSATQKAKPKKGSIAASFASSQASNKKAQETKTEKTQEQSKAKTEKTQEQPKAKTEKTQEQPKAKKKEEPKPKQKGMLAFMSQKKKEEPPPGPVGDSEKDDRRLVKEEKEDEMEDVDVESCKQEKTKKVEVKGGRSKRSSQADKKKKRIEVSDSESDDERQKRTVARKRRRIIQQDNSSSEEEEEDEEQDDMDDSPIPPTPPPVAQPVQSDEEDEATPQSKSQSEERLSSGKRRIRKRVLKSKVTVDEEGCMVTEKVWENESTDVSDEDVPPSAPKPKPQPKKEDKDSDEEEDKKGKKGRGKKTSPPSSKGKQSSLMSFFKKK